MRQIILVIDDHPAWRDVLRYKLRQDFNVIVEYCATSGQETLDLIEKIYPRLIILDIKLNGTCGLRLCQHLQRRNLSSAYLILTAYDEDVYLAQALEYGAVGYVLKTEDSDFITEQVRQAVQGELLWTSYQLLRVQHWQQVAGRKWETLTEREQEVVGALTTFRNNAEIADLLQISPATVHQHLHNIFTKLDMFDRREVTRWAVKHHLVEAVNS